MNTPNTAQLKDIKDIVVIEDYSLYYLLFLVFVVFLIVSIIIYKKMTKITKSKQPTKREIAISKLQALDLDDDDTKDIVYTISIEGALVIKSNKELEDRFEQLQQLIEPYKYKKETIILDNDIKSYIKEFIKDIK